jgi:hypothetical protein
MPTLAGIDVGADGAVDDDARNPAP